MTHWDDAQGYLGQTEPRYPHCDARILHAPGECRFCDLHPDWQELRKVWMVAFTGHAPSTHAHAGTQVPCPADYNRPPLAPNDHRHWRGNVATTAEPVNESAASRMIYGPQPYPGFLDRLHRNIKKHKNILDRLR